LEQAKRRSKNTGDKSMEEEKGIGHATGEYTPKQKKRFSGGGLNKGEEWSDKGRKNTAGKDRAQAFRLGFNALGKTGIDGVSWRKNQRGTDAIAIWARQSRSPSDAELRCLGQYS